MIKYLESIYSFQGSNGRSGVYVILADGCKHIVIEHEGKMYALAHMRGEDIKRCLLPITDTAAKIVNDGVSMPHDKETKQGVGR